MNKRGVSYILSAVVIMLLSIVAVSFVWVILRPVIIDSFEEQAGVSGCVELNLEAVSCATNTTSNVSLIKIARGAGSNANLTGVKIIFKNSSGATMVVDEKVKIRELESKTFFYTDSAIARSVSADVTGIIGKFLCPYSENPVTCTSNAPDVIAQCADNIDNDGDGWIDFDGAGGGLLRADPGCLDIGDNSETNGNTGFECSDNIDNDGDGLADGNDPECVSWNGINERFQGTPIGRSNFCRGFGDDIDYLYNLTTNIFVKPDGKKSFSVKRQSDNKILRESFADEKFFLDNTGALNVIYDIFEICGGVDIVYTVVNPSASAQNAPGFFVEGIMQKTSGDFYLLDTKDAGFVRKINKPDGTLGTIYLSSQGFGGAGGPLSYPGFYYSPVVVTHDNDFSSGTALHYPYLTYKHEVVPYLERVASGTQAGTWRHYYTSGSSPKIASGETRTYKVSARFSDSRNWLLTLKPYKDYFKSTYGNLQQVRPKDRRPVHGIELAGSQFYNSQSNSRSYRTDSYFGTLVNINDGWNSFISNYLSELSNNGYKRAMIWTPSGLYAPTITCTLPGSPSTGQNCNYPPSFMDFLPYLANTAGEFTRFVQNNIELGFWWGRAARVPNPEQWDPSNLINADYNNAQHKTFLSNQLGLAYNRGAVLVGLDEFSPMPAYDRYLWIDEMKAQTNSNILFVHEGSGPDLMHGKIANFYWPTSYPWWTQFDKSTIDAPDVLSDYLNEGAEIWVLHRSPAYWSLDLVKKFTSWGYTSVYFGYPSQYTINVAGVNDLELVECIDGIDNESPFGDGKIDWPYDPECSDAGDDSE